MRLQKYMAECGVASRRKSEELIAQGKVFVNGKRVTEMGFQVDPDRDEVVFAGKRLKCASKKIYLMLNKPAGCVSTCHDEKGRKTIMAYLPNIKERLYPVGRLDFTTEGLLIMTNDGELTNALTHPKHGVQKKYLAVIDSDITPEEIQKLEQGVIIDGYKTAPAIFHLLSRSDNRSEILCVISEGKNRPLRRMFEAVGTSVLYLKRVAVGDLRLENLKKGTYRPLSAEEIRYLKNLNGK